MTWTAESIRPQYSRFLDNYNNTMFANHSHQAWPNVARFGHLKAFDLAASNHGAKWGEVEKARKFLKGFISQWIGNENYGGADGICWGQNTFELVGSFLTGLNLEKGDIIVTSDTEFHSMRRLLQAYESKGVTVVRVATWTEEEAKEGTTGAGFFSRMDDAFRSISDISKLKAILFSSVSYKTGSLLPKFKGNLESLLLRGVPVLVDLYHHVGTKTFKVPSVGHENLYLVGGGYKYLQMGEGNAWMRAPLSSQLEPLMTGWFAEFEGLEMDGTSLMYPESAERFRGATYEPTSILRGREVAQFFMDIGFDSESLAQKYEKDCSYIYDRLSRLLGRLPESYKERNDLYLISHESPSVRAGFVSLHFKNAMVLHAYLEKNFIETDYRGEIIRFGPAPYTMQMELDKLLDCVTDYFEGEI